MSFEFPDTLPSTESQYATYIPWRTPEFKVHRTEGLAHSALGQRSYDEPYAKYELKGGVWHKVFEYQPADVCGFCKGSLRVGTPSGGWRYSRNESLSKAPKWTKKPICRNCYNIQNEQRKREMQEQRERAELARLSKKYE